MFRNGWAAERMGGERLAAGILSAARTGAQTVVPALAGATLVLPTLGLPLLIAGGLKIVYDLALWLSFRQVRPPEEWTKA